MRSASHASRRITAGVSSRPSSVTAAPVVPEGGPVDPALQDLQGGGDRDPGSGAVAVRGQVGGQGVVAGLDQGVPQPGAVVARIHGLLTRPGRGGRPPGPAW